MQDFFKAFDSKPVTKPSFTFFEWQLFAGNTGFGSILPYDQHKDGLSVSLRSKNCSVSSEGCSTVNTNSGAEDLITRSQSNKKFSFVDNINKSSAYELILHGIAIYCGNHIYFATGYSKLFPPKGHQLSVKYDVASA